MKPNLIQTLMTVIALTLWSTTVIAKDFPQKPINLVVPFAPGGGTDSIARDLAKNLTEQLGQAVIVDNRAGGGGAIGAQMVAKADPDGYTLLFVTSTFITHAATETTLTYDVIKDFSPIAMIGRGPLMVVANSELGLNSIQDLIKYTKSNPTGVNFCSAGQGSINHLAGELFKQKTSLEMTHVPYKGSGPATLDLLAGRVQVFFATMPTMLQYVKSNKVTLLAMTSDKRSNLFPQVPTVAESGVPGFNITTWWGVVAPAKLPPEILKKLNREIRIASAKEPLKTRLVNEGATPFHTEPEEMQNLLEKELKMWRELVKTANIKVN
ncbi:tripartite tricarboxylate transporter substrate binding protein [Polynucleobacter kasalickyi]|uniref:Tripartite-type tricarboxylate transporter, receptor component TctC n=1 Tax=Polynucleobacter kasalickyi TaxID=1938817 RepID=A0A1W1YD85_9BURK|nr:tripartite tricarboxylate transporter substrate binding protein [Polynucleobacter kasalickyi]SMC34127.1 Tripartite-type tricarboxylate transporter, receptor component TctC [Polynucleobacter kasalickyi]